MNMYEINGELAQSGRAPALQAGGNRFETDILHQFTTNGDAVGTGLALAVRTL